MSVTLNGHTYDATDFTAQGGYGYTTLGVTGQPLFPNQIFADMLAVLAGAAAVGGVAAGTAGNLLVSNGSAWTSANFSVAGFTFGASTIISTVNDAVSYMQSGAGTSYKISGVSFQHAGTNRWLLYKSNDAAGDLTFARYADGGGFVDIPFQISRSSGSIVISTTMLLRENIDSTVVFGRAVIDSRSSNVVYLSHYAMLSASQYALSQNSSGTTAINAATGQSVLLCVNNTPFLTVAGSTVTTSVNLTPATDNARSLGTSGLRWSDFRSVLATFSGLVTAGAGITLTGSLVFDNTTTDYSITGSSDKLILGVQGYSNAWEWNSGGHMYPSVTNTFTLGLSSNRPSTIFGVLGDFTGAVTVLTLKVGSSQVVGARDTGWTAMTGTPDKASAYATSTVTLAQLAGRVAQIQASLTTHGLIGA